MDSEKQAALDVQDGEHGMNHPHPTTDHDVEKVHIDTERQGSLGWFNKLLAFDAIEAAGIQPVPVSERTNNKIYEIFTLWFTLSTNLLPYGSSTSPTFR